MAALDLTAPTYLPTVKRLTLVGTTCREIDLPTSHGWLRVVLHFTGAGKVAFDPTKADGDAFPSDYHEITEAGTYSIDIPPQSHTGIAKLHVAAASGTVSVCATINRIAGAQ